MSKTIVWPLIMLGSALLVVLPATRVSISSAEAGGTLNSTQQAALWTGSVNRNDAPTGEIPECTTVPCDRFDLNVHLPTGVWNNKPGGVEVSIRFGGVAFDNLRLFVYREGSLVASSAGIISTAQSVLIPEAQNGDYAVYAAYDTDSPSTVIPYEGLAEVEYLPNPHPTRPLLPDLTSRQQRNASFDPMGIFFDTISVEHPSCYESEVQEEGAQTCLRFDQVFANIGEGPMAMRFVIPHDPTSTAHNIFQRIYWSDSPTHFDTRLVGEWEFHPVHGHYHYAGFGRSRLWQIDVHGQRVGSVPIRSSRKIGFCLADIELDAWNKKGSGPRTINAPDCLFPAESDAENDYLIQGITSGWADVYDWYLPDQYIEVTGLPDGVYLLETIVDPDNTLVEADESNNCTAVYIRVWGVGTGSPHAEILGPAPPC